MNTKELQLVTLEQAKRLKTVGFNWGCEEFYLSDASKSRGHYCNWNCGNEISAPTVPLALKWIREVKGVIAFVYFDPDYNQYYFYRNVKLPHYCDLDGFESYEAAESALLYELLTLLKPKL